MQSKPEVLIVGSMDALDATDVPRLNKSHLATGNLSLVKPIVSPLMLISQTTGDILRPDCSNVVLCQYVLVLGVVFVRCQNLWQVERLVPGQVQIIVCTNKIGGFGDPEPLRLQIIALLDRYAIPLTEFLAQQSAGQQGLGAIIRGVAPKRAYSYEALRSAAFRRGELMNGGSPSVE